MARLMETLQMTPMMILVVSLVVAGLKGVMMARYLRRIFVVVVL